MAKQVTKKGSDNKFDFTPPSKLFARSFIAPFKFYFAPQFYGLDEVDVSKPAMYVSNHTILGVFDGYPFAIELYLRKGIILRALADSTHWYIPVWKDIISNRLGVVEASRENCRKLMQRKDSIVVFPGGTREVCKKKGEQYVLKWSDRKGFVRMAMEYGYDIIPVAAVGAEETFTVVKDANDILHSSFGKFLKLIGVAEKYFKNGDLLPPIVRGIGATVIPRPAKLYFSFGKRISTSKYKSNFTDEGNQDLVKNMVEKALLSEFHKLFEIRAKDKDRGKWRRLLNMKKPKESVR
jgi:1-acyl-sn-glycerol-3-phosphate acyltransferase